MNLAQIGWSERFEALFQEHRRDGLIPARVSLQHKNRYRVACELGDYTAEATGRMMNQMRSRADMPAVGDWVVIAPRPNEGAATIHHLLPRSSTLSRKAILSGGNPDADGKTDEQVLAANVDVVFLVSGLDGDYNIRRIERFVTVAWDSGASPVILLNKSDVCPEVDEVVAEVEEIAIGIPVHVMSAVLDEGTSVVQQHLPPGVTGAFLGSSGVGKSTIINALLGEERLDTGGVRPDDSKGRHTTSHRELIVLPEGGIVIDTPGMRRLKLWGDEESIQRTFADVEAIFADCRFRDCAHNGEPGCAIARALEDGTLDTGRWNSYLKLQKELRHLERRKNAASRRALEREWVKKINQTAKGIKEARKKGLI